jgi:hypothetical protein
MAHFEHHSSEERRVIEDRQQQEVERPMSKGPEYFVRTRTEDFSIWAQIGFYLDKYKLILYLLIAALVALGFDFKTPAQTYKIMNDRIDTLALTVQRGSTASTQQNLKLDALLRLACIQQQPRDMQLAGVNCGALITIQPGK